MRKFSITILIAAATWTACENPVSNSGIHDVNEQTAETGKLHIRLATTGTAATNDSVMLSFTVINNADTVQRFCKWETPFEPLLGKYFEITDDQGNEAMFRGAMARRVMPPPPEAYIEVPAHDSVWAVTNLADKYSFTGGQYTVKYSGGGVSGLEAGNEIKINIATP